MSATLRPPPFWMLATHNLIVASVFAVLGVIRNGWLLGLFATFNLMIWALIIPPLLRFLHLGEIIWFIAYGSLEIGGYIIASMAGYCAGTARSIRWLTAAGLIIAAAGIEWAGMIWF